MNDALRIEGLKIARGGKPVLHGIDLAIPSGRITTMLGPNGAGKSSLVLAIAGALPPTAGRVLLDGRPLKGLRPESVRALGIAAVPEGHRVLSELTVHENLRVAGDHLARRSLSSGIDEALATFPELAERLNQRAGSLSGGQQQMVALAQAIVGQPRFLLADELSFGLAPVVVSRLVPVLTGLADKGVGILLIEQFTTIALKIAERACVMERGRICFEGAPADLLDKPEILHDAYLSSR